MAKVLITKSKLDNLAEAISEKSEVATPLTIDQMTAAVQSIVTGSTINNQNKTITPTTSQQTVTADSGYTGLGTVTVNAVPTETKTVTTNGTYTPTTGNYFSTVTVNVPTVNISQDANGYIVLDDDNNGGLNFNWLATQMAGPSPKNFFYSLINGNIEHGEISFSNCPNNEFLNVFTLQNIQINHLQGFMFIDKDFYQGIENLPHQSSEGLGMLWFDKAFVNSAQISANSGIEIFGALRMMIDQTSTANAGVATAGLCKFDGETSIFRQKWQFINQSLQTKWDYTNNVRYSSFIKDRTYIWIAY